MARNRLTAFIITIFWGAIQVFWLYSDRLIRDGDEEGHVGAAELFRDILRDQGFFRWLYQGWQGDFGEYPPLFAALFGAWWSVFSVPPESTIIRLFGSLFIFGTACMIGRIVWRLRSNWLLGFSAVLLLPLMNGVGRHFMPEVLLSFLTAGFAMTLVEETESPSIKNKLLIGFMGGLGLLAKQSFLLFAPMITLGFLLSRKLSFRSLTLPSLLALGISGPWYFQQFSAQNQYIQSSIQAKTDIELLAHFAFYPSTLLLIGWGCLGTGIFLYLFFKNRDIKLPLWSLIWALGGLLLLILLPKKYPRLLLPWLVLLGIFLGTLGKNNTDRSNIFYVTLLFLQFIFFSFFPKPITLPFQLQIDDGCPQAWLRSPSTSDLQLERVSKIIKENSNKSLAILGDVTIDCALQSTHNWNAHLEPYLRRNALNPPLAFVEEKNSLWKEAQIQIEWKTTTATDNPDDLLIEIRD